MTFRIMKTPILVFLIYLTLLLNLSAQSDSVPQKGFTDKEVFGEKDEHINNFTGYLYYIPENTWQLPDFNKLTPVGRIYTNSLNIPEQSFEKGFPGVSDRFEYFAIDYKGEFYLKDSNLYCFSLGSDDGSKLFIDGNLIVNNDYQHSVKYETNYVILKKGIHEIEVQYFQGPRNSVALILTYKKVYDKNYELFNLSKLYPISVNDNDSTIDISIGNEILFEFDSFQLSEAAKKALNDIKRIIIDKTKIKSIVIEGHTDDIGSEDYNMKLSVNRANAVKDYMIKAGSNSQYYLIRGCGKSKPKVPNVDEESRKKNRRIEMSIIKL